MEQQQLKQMINNAQNNKPHVGVIAAVGTDSSVPEECAIPNFVTENYGGDFRWLVEEHKTLFGIIPGKLHLIDCHHSPQVTFIR